MDIYLRRTLVPHVSVLERVDCSPNQKTLCYESMLKASPTWWWWWWWGVGRGGVDS